MRWRIDENQLVPLRFCCLDGIFEFGSEDSGNRRGSVSSRLAPNGGGACLRIDIDDCSTDPGLLGGYGQVNTERGLGRATLLLHKCNPSHGFLLRIVLRDARTNPLSDVCHRDIAGHSRRVTRDARYMHHASVSGQANVRSKWRKDKFEVAVRAA
jgi:hypothetical protein